jgi:hypothetical protein
MRIDKDLLKSWNACTDGYSWFIKKFPQGGDVHEVGAALREDKRYEDAKWLTSNVFNSFIKAPQEIESYVVGDVAAALKSVEGSPDSATGNSSTAASSGDYSKAASSGNYSTAASSGYYSTAASSGDYSKAASSGDYSKAASSGNSSTAASSGDYSKAASSGNSSKAEAKGKKTIAMVAGVLGQARAGEKGAFAMAWYDEANEQMQIAVGVVGTDGVKADTWYRVTDGKLEEVTA